VPYVKWLQGKPKPKIRFLAALLRQYIKDNKLTSVELGERLNCSPESVRAQIGKRADEWRLGSLLSYCSAIGVPLEEAFHAVILEAAEAARQ
jgi:hypothetical protein